MHHNIFRCCFIAISILSFFVGVGVEHASSATFQGGSSVLDKQPEAEAEQPASPIEPAPEAQADPIDEKFDTIVKKCNEAMQKHFQRVQSADPKDQARIQEEENPVNKFANEFLQLAADHPNTNAAYNSISFLVVNGSGKIKSNAIDRMLKDYRDDPRIINNLTAITMRAPGATTEKLLTQIATESKNKTVRGRAIRTNIDYLRSLRQIKKLMTANPSFADRLGKDVVEFVKKFDFESATKRETELLEKLAADFSDVPSGTRGKTLGDVAKLELFNRENFSVGSQAPEIIGIDFDREKIQLTDFRDKVVLLIFWGNWSRGSQLMYPQLRSLRKKLKGKPFRIVGVNTDPDLRATVKTFDYLQLDWRNFWDKNNRGKITTAWQIRRWPSVFILDEKGVIRYKDIAGKEIDKALTAMMKERGHDVDLSDHSDGELASPTPKAKEEKPDDQDDKS